MQGSKGKRFFNPMLAFSPTVAAACDKEYSGLHFVYAKAHQSILTWTIRAPPRDSRKFEIRATFVECSLGEKRKLTKFSRIVNLLKGYKKSIGGWQLGLLDKTAIPALKRQQNRCWSPLGAECLAIFRQKKRSNHQHPKFGHCR